MPGFPLFYGKDTRIMMFRLSSFYCNSQRLNVKGPSPAGVKGLSVYAGLAGSLRSAFAWSSR